MKLGEIRILKHSKGSKPHKKGSLLTKVRTLLITLGVASTLGVMVTYVREAGMGMTPADVSRVVGNQRKVSDDLGTKGQIEGNTIAFTDSARTYESTLPSKISAYRKQYMLWDLFNVPNINDEPARNGKGYLIYRCAQYCGGWADRVKGALFTYVAAILTGRTFKAQFLRPGCDMSQLILPNRVNWTIDDKLKPDHSQSEMVGLQGNGALKLRIYQVNFTELFNPQKEYLFVVTNMDYISNIKNSSVYTEEIAWMKDLSPADIYGAAYKRIFKLAPPLQTVLDDIIYQNLPTSKHRLICIHVRLGHEAFGSDYAKRNSVENLPKIWRFIATQSQTEFDKVFVMSDSSMVVDSAKNQSFADRLVLVPGQIVHIDKWRFSDKKWTDACEGYERLLVEFHMLMNCDILVRGHSGISVIASTVRGSDQGLYCLQDNGDILSCLRNDFSEFY